MEIVGNGFLARNLRPISGRHADTVVLAAGVSWADGVSSADFVREAELLHHTTERCVSEGRRLVFFSTASTGMYGSLDGPGREDSTVVPSTPYGAHKLSLEQQLYDTDVDFLVLRLGHLVGARQPPHQLIPTLIRQMRQGQVHVYRGAVRDLIDVNDVVTIIDELLARSVARTTVNVASGVAVPAEHIIDHIGLRSGLNPERKYHDAGNHHTICIERLRRLVSEVASMKFATNYYKQVLDNYIGEYSAAGDPPTDELPGSAPLVSDGHRRAETSPADQLSETPRS